MGEDSASPMGEDAKARNVGHGGGGQQAMALGWDVGVGACKINNSFVVFIPS